MFPCHIWKSTTLKTLLQQTLACNSYHSGRFGRLIPEPFIFTVRSRDTQQKQNKVWRGRRGRRERHKRNDACKVHCCVRRAWSLLTSVAGTTQPSLRTAADSWSHTDSPVPAALRTDRCTGNKPYRDILSMPGNN